LRELDGRGGPCRVLFVHAARSQPELIFRAELERLRRRNPWLEIRLHLSGEAGHMDAATWERLADETRGRPAFLCGPAAFMADVRRAWSSRGGESLLASESFGVEAPRCDDGAAAHEIVAARSATTFVAGGSDTLLV